MFRLQEHLFFILFAAALILAWFDKSRVWIRTPFDVPLLCFVGWVLCTVPFAADPGYSFSEWRKVVAHILVFYWAMYLLCGPGKVANPRHILWAVVIGSFVLSGYALADFVARGGTWRDRVIRAGAPTSDYNWLTTYLVLVIPIVIGWVVNPSAFWARRLGVLTLLAAGFAQVAAYTRAGWVAHVAQVMYFGLVTGRRRLLIGMLVGGIMMMTMLLVLVQHGYQRETVDPWTLKARTKTWALGFQQIVQHPVVGIGYGNETFLRLYHAEVEAEKDKGAVEKVLPALHSTFLMILVGSGVPAFFFFAWAMGCLYQNLVLGAKTSTSLPTRIFLFSIAAALVGFIVRNCFDYMFSGSLVHLFWILMATGVALKAEQ